MNCFTKPPQRLLKKCKLQCDEFFLPSPCKFEKDGLRLDLEQELFESADDDNDVMSKPYE